jgi:HSP20 family protein
VDDLNGVRQRAKRIENLLNMSVLSAYFMNLLCYIFIRLVERLGLIFWLHQILDCFKGDFVMTISRWYPIREVATLQNRVNSLFQDFAGDSEPVTTASFAPAVDVFENTEKVVLKLDIPGIKEEDLDIRVENQALTVRGERKFEAEEKEENFHRIERRYGSFYRSFSLPTSVDTENVAASYDAGVLKLELKKKASAQPRQIKIASGNGNTVNAAA